MPIQPKPYKLRCQYCNHTKIVKFTSDCINPQELIYSSTKCPKCGHDMKYNRLSIVELTIHNIRYIF